MSQKKTLSKNRKRKAIIRKANPTLAFGDFIRPQKGEIIALYNPNKSVDECMVDLAKRIHGVEIHPNAEKFPQAAISWHKFEKEIKAVDEFHNHHMKNSFHPQS